MYDMLRCHSKENEQNPEIFPCKMFKYVRKDVQVKIRQSCEWFHTTRKVPNLVFFVVSDTFLWQAVSIKSKLNKTKKTQDMNSNKNRPTITLPSVPQASNIQFYTTASDSHPEHSASLPLPLLVKSWPLPFLVITLPLSHLPLSHSYLPFLHGLNYCTFNAGRPSLLLCSYFSPIYYSDYCSPFLCTFHPQQHYL